MKRRPVCLVCLLLMLCMYILDQAGVALIKGNPLPEQTVKYIEEHQEAVVCGEIQRYQDTSNSLSVCLKQVSLICGSETFPIKNLKVFLKNEQRFPAGTKVMISGKLERPEVPRNPGEFDSRQYYACQHIYYCMKNGVITRHSRNGSGYEQFWLDFREKLCQIFQVTTGNDAGVFEAMLLGEKSDLDQERKMRYQMAGMIHILAISGVKTLKLDIPLVPETRINWAFVPLHIAIIYILKLCLDEEIIPRCRFPCSRGYFTKCINRQKKQ